MSTERAHPALHELLGRIQGIYEVVSNFRPNNTRPPILDSSLSLGEEDDDGHPSHQDHIPGLKKLKESLKLDLDGLQKFLDDPDCVNRPPPSTNAPYLISVWHELLCAPSPVISVFKMFFFEPKSDQPSSSLSKAAMRQKNHGISLRPPGAKVDIVADAGKVWIRVNTVKNSRLLAEFREIDSYLTESEEDSDWDNAKRPTLAQSEFDNSILKMGRALLQAAQANPVVEGTAQLPRVIMRLTRLNPYISDGPEADPRISKTVEMLKGMGVEVQLGERSEEELVPSSASTTGDAGPVVPSRRINLDLSVVIALISEMTHAPLPKSVEEANKRFIPPQEYLEWKEARRKRANKWSTPKDLEEEGMSIEDLPHYLATHSRALTHQLLGEMGKSMIQEIRDRIDQTGPSAIENVEFWVTTEARDRCLRIVSKIGAVNEKRRAYSLFCIDPSDPSRRLSLEEAEELFWQNSRFDRTLPLFPLRFHSSALPPDNSIFSERANRHVFFKELAGTCQHILDQEVIPHPNARPSSHFQFISQRTPFPSHPSQHYDANGRVLPTSEPPTAASDAPSIDFAAAADEEIQRAVVTKANPRLTAHTVESMLWGAELGWTTLTANRTSVRAILKEVRVARVLGKLEGLSLGNRDSTVEEGDDERRVTTGQVAALWIVDPRSLAEQMCGEDLYDPKN